MEAVQRVSYSKEFSIMSRNAFTPLGKFGQHFAEFNLNKAKAASTDGVSALNGNYSWKAYLVECPDHIARVA